MNNLLNNTDKKREFQKPLGATKEQTLNRIYICYDYLINGISGSDVYKMQNDESSQHYWSLSKTGFYTLWRKARLIYEKNIYKDITKIKIKKLKQLDYIYKMQMENNDFKGALQTIKMQNEMLGLYQDYNVNINSSPFLTLPDIDTKLLIERIKESDND